MWNDHRFVQVMVFGYDGQAYGDTSICLGDTTFIYANNGEIIFWFPANSLSNPDSSYTFAYPVKTPIIKLLFKQL